MEDAAHPMFDFMRRSIGVASCDFWWLCLKGCGCRKLEDKISLGNT
jgi:hypothetical protein